jgi:hypothetical protein
MCIRKKSTGGSYGPLSLAANQEFRALQAILYRREAWSAMRPTVGSPS